MQKSVCIWLIQKAMAVLLKACEQLGSQKCFPSSSHCYEQTRWPNEAMCKWKQAENWASKL